jgi:hypothetical protein
MINECGSVGGMRIDYRNRGTWRTPASLSIFSMTLQPFRPGRFFSFFIVYTVGRTPSMGDQPVARPLPTHRINAHTHIHALNGIQTHDPYDRAGEVGSCLRPRGHCDRPHCHSVRHKSYMTWPGIESGQPWWKPESNTLGKSMVMEYGVVLSSPLHTFMVGLLDKEATLPLNVITLEKEDIMILTTK